jgi:hypothetical protein
MSSTEISTTTGYHDLAPQSPMPMSIPLSSSLADNHALPETTAYPQNTIPDQTREDKKASRKRRYRKWKRIARRTAAIAVPIISFTLQIVLSFVVT